MYGNPTDSQGNIESLKDFKKDKQDQHDRWAQEFAAADKASRKFTKQGNKTISKYLNDKKGSEASSFRLNLFYSNINTVRDLMFGSLPEITFSRKNQDFNDDVARVAGLIYERMLNADIGTPNDQYSDALKQCLQDRLLPGMGVARVRYDFNEEKEQISAVVDIKTGVEL